MKVSPWRSSTSVKPSTCTCLAGSSSTKKNFRPECAAVWLRQAWLGLAWLGWAGLGWAGLGWAGLRASACWSALTPVRQNETIEWNECRPKARAARNGPVTGTTSRARLPSSSVAASRSWSPHVTIQSSQASGAAGLPDFVRPSMHAWQKRRPRRDQPRKRASSVGQPWWWRASTNSLAGLPHERTHTRRGVSACGALDTKVDPAWRHPGSTPEDDETAWAWPNADGCAHRRMHMHAPFPAHERTHTHTRARGLGARPDSWPRTRTRARTAHAWHNLKFCDRRSTRQVPSPVASCSRGRVREPKM